MTDYTFRARKFYIVVYFFIALSLAGISSFAVRNLSGLFEILVFALGLFLAATLAAYVWKMVRYSLVYESKTGTLTEHLGSKQTILQLRSITKIANSHSNPREFSIAIITKENKLEVTITDFSLKDAHRFFAIVGSYITPKVDVDPEIKKNIATAKTE